MGTMTDHPGSHPPEDAEIVRQVLAGRVEAFSELVKRYQSKIYMMALYHVRRPAAAEDVVQEVFIATYQSLGRFDQSRSFTNWILKIATNHCYKALRKKAPVPLPDAEIPIFCDPLDEQLRRERQETVGAAMARLPDDFKLVVWLFYFFERSYQQISEILEIPQHLVKIRLFRARRMLGQTLQKETLADSPAALGNESE